MKLKIPLSFLGLLAVGSASAQGLYYVGSEAQESIPLKWVVGADVTYDDNVSPGFGPEESSFGTNPYVGLSFVSMTPQTTWDVYARLGLIYYFDAPDYMDDVSSQSRAGLNLTHRFSERLRLSSRNFISYELEPDYSYGYASSRQAGEYFFWQSDNSLGYRWTERVATYTGLRLSGTTSADADNSDRFTWELYNQFRYQLSPQTVLTADYRYSQTSGDGVSSDSSDHYILGGLEHRFSPNTIGIVRAGAQFHDVDDGDSTSSPYLEFAFNSQINQQFGVRAFARYGIETYDTVQAIAPAGLVEYDDRQTLRLGVSATYAVSPTFSVFSGIDYIPTSYASGRSVTNPPFLGSIPDADEDMLNAYIGLSMKINDYLTGTATYNYTNSSSDINGRDYDRNRFSVGVSAEF
jgi:predicted porin